MAGLDWRARSSGLARALLGLLGFALLAWIFYLTRLPRLLIEQRHEKLITTWLAARSPAAARGGP